MAPGNRHQSQSCGQGIFPYMFPRGNDCSEQKCCKPGSRRKRSSHRASNSVKQLTLSPDHAGSTKQNLSPLLPVLWASCGPPRGLPSARGLSLWMPWMESLSGKPLRGELCARHFDVDRWFNPQENTVRENCYFQIYRGENQGLWRLSNSPKITASQGLSCSWGERNK